MESCSVNLTYCHISSASDSAKREVVAKAVKAPEVVTEAVKAPKVSGML